MKIRLGYGQVVSLPERKTQGADALHIDVARSPLADVHPSGVADASATGFVLSLLQESEGPILWVQDHASRRENGQPYAPGLKTMGINQTILKVTVSHPRDVLWTMEEGATCAGLSAVIGEIHGAPAALSFTATKRLAIRAEESGVPVYLIRSGDPGILSAARTRWRLTSLPSALHPHDGQAPGIPQWDAELFRVRGRMPGRWVARYDPEAKRPADRLRLVPRVDDGALDAGHQPLQDHSGA